MYVTDAQVDRFMRRIHNTAVELLKRFKGDK